MAKQKVQRVISFQVEPPDDLLSSVSVPSTDKIHFHPLVSYTNRHGGVGPDQFPLRKISFRFQIDDIHTSFVQVSGRLTLSLYVSSDMCCLQPWIS